MTYPASKGSQRGVGAGSIQEEEDTQVMSLLMPHVWRQAPILRLSRGPSGAWKTLACTWEHAVWYPALWVHPGRHVDAFPNHLPSNTFYVPLAVSVGIFQSITSPFFCDFPTQCQIQSPCVMLYCAQVRKCVVYSSPKALNSRGKRSAVVVLRGQLCVS